MLPLFQLTSCVFRVNTYQGYDFGWHFGLRAFLRDMNNPFNFRIQDYPTDEQLITFVEIYLDEMRKLTGSASSTVEQLVYECKVFITYVRFYGTSMLFSSENDPSFNRQQSLVNCSHSLNDLENLMEI